MVSTNYKTLFSNKLKGGLGSIKNHLASSINNTLLAQLVEMNTGIRKSIDRVDTFISIFSGITDTISGDDNPLISPSDINPVPISSDDAEYIEDVLSAFTESYGKCAVSDVNGWAYNFFPVNNAFLLNGEGYESMLATCAAPSEIEECVLYRKVSTNEVFFNPVLRTFDFIEKEVSDDTIFNRLRQSALAKGIEFNNTLAINDDEGTILNKLRALNPDGTTLYELSLFASPSSYGHVRYFWDVFRDLIESNELNGIISNTISALSSGIDGFKTWFSGLQGAVDSRVQAVKTYFAGLSTAFIEGGFKGAIAYVFAYFRAAQTISGDDGKLKMTENSGIVPVQYIVGMVGTVISTIFQLVGAIITAIYQPIGLMLTALGSIGYGIFQSLNYDSSKTRCGIQTSDIVAVNAAPYALAECTFPLDSDYEILSGFLQSVGFFYLKVPGGIILCGPGGFASDGTTVTSMSMEFHPSLEDRRQLFSEFANMCTSCELEYQEPQPGLRNYYYVYSEDQSENSFVILNYNAFKQEVIDKYDSLVVPYQFENAENNTLTESDDKIMRKIVMSNTWAFMYWALCLAAGVDSVHYVYADSKYLDNPHKCFAVIWEQDKDWGMSHYTLANMLIALSPFSDNPVYLSSDRWLPAWKPIADRIFVNLQENSTLAYGLRMAILDENEYWFDEPILMPSSYAWALVPAKYDARTFLSHLIGTIVVSVAITAITVVVALKVKQKIFNKRAALNASVENAWSSYTKGDISYKEYKKTVKKANRWQKLIGGTKWDYENYWNGDQSSSSSSDDSQSSLSNIKSILNGDTAEETIAIDGEEYNLAEAVALLGKMILNVGYMVNDSTHLMISLVTGQSPSDPSTETS